MYKFFLLSQHRVPSGAVISQPATGKLLLDTKAPPSIRKSALAKLKQRTDYCIAAFPPVTEAIFKR